MFKVAAPILSVRDAAIDWLKMVFRPQSAVLQSPDIQDANAKLGDAERSLRTLRKRLEEINASTLSDRFAREEMRARHLRYGDRDISLWEHRIGNLYWLTSRYGDSLWRPLASVVLVGAAFTAIYDFLLGKAGNLSDAFLVSINVTLRPMFQLSPAYGRESGVITDEGFCEATNLMANKEARSGSFEAIQYLTNCSEVAFKLISFTHALMVIVFLFLAALAIRRKLRLS